MLIIKKHNQKKQKTIKKQTFINNKNKENNENLEISDLNFDHLKRSTFVCKFNRIIDSPKCNLNKKNNEPTMKYINYGVKTFENRFHKNRGEKRNSLDSGKCKKTDNILIKKDKEIFQKKEPEKKIIKDKKIEDNDIKEKQDINI